MRKRTPLYPAVQKARDTVNPPIFNELTDEDRCAASRFDVQKAISEGNAIMSNNDKRSGCGDYIERHRGAAQTCGVNGWMCQACLIQLLENECQEVIQDNEALHQVISEMRDEIDTLTSKIADLQRERITLTEARRQVAESIGRGVDAGNKAVAEMEERIKWTGEK